MFNVSPLLYPIIVAGLVFVVTIVWYLVYGRRRCLFVGGKVAIIATVSVLVMIGCFIWQGLLNLVTLCEEVVAFGSDESARSIEIVDIALNDKRSRLDDEFFEIEDPLLMTFRLEFEDGKFSWLSFHPVYMKDDDVRCKFYYIVPGRLFIEEMEENECKLRGVPESTARKLLESLDASGLLKKLEEETDGPIRIEYVATSLWPASRRGIYVAENGTVNKYDQVEKKETGYYVFSIVATGACNTIIIAA